MVIFIHLICCSFSYLSYLSYLHKYRVCFCVCSWPNCLAEVFPSNLTNVMSVCRQTPPPFHLRLNGRSIKLGRPDTIYWKFVIQIKVWKCICPNSKMYLFNLQKYLSMLKNIFVQFENVCYQVEKYIYPACKNYLSILKNVFVLETEWS